MYQKFKQKDETNPSYAQCQGELEYVKCYS